MKQTKKKNTNKKLRKKLNRKGFTLIELLAVIAVLSLVISITMYSVTSLIKNAKEKTYDTTVNEIEKAAGNYSFEDGDKINFAPIANSNFEYQCITVKELIDAGFLDNNITESSVKENVKVDVQSYVYLERNVNNKTITKRSYAPSDESAALICNYVVNVNAFGQITAVTKPEEWSREKDITVNYSLKGKGKSVDKSNYQFLYEYTNADGSRGSYNNQVSSASTTFHVTQKGSVYANIWRLDTDNLITDFRFQIDKFDNKGPTIALVNPTSEAKIVERAVDIPIKVFDCDNKDECSGLEDITNNAILKNKIVNTGKLKVFIGDKEAKNITLTYVNFGKYNINIKNTDNYNGPVKILFLKDIFNDKVADEVKNYNEETPLEPNIIFDNEKLQIDVSNSSDPFVTVQNAKLKCVDNYPGITYYIGKTRPTSSTKYLSADNIKNSAGKYEIVVDDYSINGAGTYYFSCRDAKNEPSTIDIEYWNYTVKGLLNTLDGDEGKYTKSNYNEETNGTFLGIDGMNLSFTELLNSNDVAKTFIKEGTSIAQYKGYSKGEPGTSSASLDYGNAKLESNMIYCLWFDRNKVKLSYNTNGGDLISLDQTLSKLDNGDILKNGNNVLQTIKYGGKLGEYGLFDWNNDDFINISNEGKIPASNQWKCMSGCSTANKTFNEDSKYMASEFCNAKNNDCYVKLGVNWNEIEYNVAFDHKYGACTTADINGIKYSQEFDVRIPCKKIKFNPKTNSNVNTDCSNPTMGSATSYDIKFDGWYIDGKLNNGTKFSKLTTKDGAKVNFVAKWVLDSNTKLKLPTVNREGCACGWNTTNGSTSWEYLSGENYNVEQINVNSNATNGWINIDIYPVCMKSGINANRCYYNNNNANDSNNHNEYYITTCEGGNDGMCSYTQKNGIASSGKVKRGNLKSEDSEYCKYIITYDCKTNGGTSNNTTQSYTYDTYEKKPDLSKTCSKSGWTFVGWNTDKNATSKITDASTIKRKDQTLYAIYKKDIVSTYYSEGYGLTVPTNINMSSYPATKFSCSGDVCTSSCTIYNKESSCTAITPEITDSRKSFFSTNKNDYSSYNSSTHLWEHAIFSSVSTKSYYVPHDNINDIRYRCNMYHDGDGKYRFRLDIFNISLCDGKNCNYSALNGIGNSSSVTRNELSTSMDYNCKAEYYSSSSLPCYAGASASTTKKATIDGCTKLSLYRTTTKINNNGSNSWYYVPDKKCYISGTTLQSSYPSSCYSSSSSPSPYTSGNGSYSVTICSNGGLLTSTMSYGCATVRYSSMQYLHPYLDNTFYRQGCYASGAGGYTSYLDASDSGKTLYVNWSCTVAKSCYSCTNSSGSRMWYQWGNGGTLCTEVSDSNCK